ncbi:unnamed protein product [Tetraodon nigroviridis]|uniref:(spotted green pufferfish) hypothetical protein n=1 Tax=Tetraodon nigroviridis TaxID=99883 RepID=Q4RQL1_TETNG|nr:unnamed protein product [Tetraodon nigroviridis]
MDQCVEYVYILSANFTQRRRRVGGRHKPLPPDDEAHPSRSSLPVCDQSQRLKLPGRRQLDEMWYPPDYWEKEALKYFRFSSILMTAADRCSKRRLPGLVSSLYSRQLTHPHYITIRLPLKVILPEHNHTQSKPQTSYITETVNSPGV